MSNIDLGSSSGEISIADHSKSNLRRLKDDGCKNIESVSLKMMEIAEKLEHLNQQCYALQVENKG